jgi:hypothetical protein
MPYGSTGTSPLFPSFSQGCYSAIGPWGSQQWRVITPQSHNQQNRFSIQLTVMALGFPAFQGGVLTYADRRGADEVLSSMKALYALCPWYVCLTNDRF